MLWFHGGSKFYIDQYNYREYIPAHYTKISYEEFVKAINELSAQYLDHHDEIEKFISDLGLK